MHRNLKNDFGNLIKKGGKMLTAMVKNQVLKTGKSECSGQIMTHVILPLDIKITNQVIQERL